MECGGKRSATPLWSQWAGQKSAKGPSPLRSAGAVHKSQSYAPHHTDRRNSLEAMAGVLMILHDAER